MLTYFVTAHGYCLHGYCLDVIRYWLLTAEGKEWKSRRAEALALEARAKKMQAAKEKELQIKQQAEKKAAEAEAKQSARDAKKDEQLKVEAAKRVELPVSDSSFYRERLGLEPELNPGLRLVPVQDVSQAEFLEVVRASF